LSKYSSESLLCSQLLLGLSHCCSSAHSYHHQAVISAKASDPLEAFKHEIAAVEADEAAAKVLDEDDAAADRAGTPDELEFEDDDGTLYKWDPQLRKYVPATAAAAADDGQQQQQPSDYDVEAMTFVEEQEVIPTLAAARAAEAAADAAANGAERQPGRDGKKVRSAGKEGAHPTASDVCGRNILFCWRSVPSASNSQQICQHHSAISNVASRMKLGQHDRHTVTCSRDVQS
jgi:hypothetical protein